MAGLLEAFQGKSPRMEALRRQVARLLGHPGGARRPPPILILGETGTGKGLLARTIHGAGPRRAGPFVDINCAAIPETLLEAELFGYERGAFTDARHAKTGLIQAAHGGTVFLDEIGLLPAALQGKLLTVLEDHAVRRLGSTHAERIDLAVVAATSVDLRRAVAEARFREDLYHRLAVITLELPPLRLRGPDILTLADHFLARACADYGLSPRALTPEAGAVLAAHPWPGNVRELANAMERVALLSDGDEVTPEMLEFLVPAERDGAAGDAAIDRSLEDAVRARIEAALRASGGNIRRTAVALGISRNTLRARMDRYGLRHRDRARPVGAPSISQATPPVAPWASADWHSRRLAFLRVRLLGSSPADGPRALEMAAEKVRAFGGRIEESGPTGLIAAFGLEPVDNASSHAALAAVAMRNTMAPDRAGAVFAIHCADHLVGRDESTPLIGMDGKAATWSLLDALAAVDAPGAIVVSGPVAPFLARRFSLERTPEGDIWRVLRLEETPGGWKATRFVGRAVELGALRRAAALAERGHGQVVGIVGEAGMGKSRLVHEATHTLQGWRLLSAGGAPYTKETPGLPLVELLKGVCGIEQTDDPATVKARIVRALPAEAAARNILSPILDLLGMLPVDDPFRDADPAQRRQRTSDAVRQVLLTASRVQPLCLVVEDLHWVDAETQEVLDGLVGGLGASRVLLLVTYRPEHRHAWDGKTGYSEVGLDALPAESAGQLLDALLGHDPGLGPLKNLLVGQGNPFFLEETVRMLVETNVLAGERGRYRLTHPVDAIAVPPTVQAMLAARIDRLPPEDRHLLQVASVVGKDVPLALLQAIADLPDDAIRPGLDRLRAAEFLRETRALPEPEYTFKHALTHEATYGTLLPDRRRALHARIVEAIERAAPDRLAGADERLAHHALRGEMWEKAITCLRQAGARAVGRSANRDAVTCFEQALAALQHLPESRHTLEQAVDLRFDLRTALFPLGESERIFGYLDEADRLVRKLDDHRRLGQLCAYLCQDYWTGGYPTKAREFGRNAQVIAESLGDFELQVTGNLYLGAALIHTGDYRRAEALLSGVLRVLGDRDRERFGLVGFPAVSARFYLTWIALSRGQFEDGIARVEEGIRLAETLDHPYTLGAARSMLAFLHMVRGELEHAIHLLERELAMPPGGSVAQHSVVNWGHLGYAYSLSGRVAEGIPLQERALRVLETIKLGAYQPTCTIQLAEAYLLAGRREDALRLAQGALAFTRERGQRPHEAWALRLLGEVATECEFHEQADRSFSDALARAEELGMRHLVAHCHLGFGRFHARSGRLERAREHLATATAMFREMGMRFWLEKSQAAMP